MLCFIKMYEAKRHLTLVKIKQKSLGFRSNMVRWKILDSALTDKLVTYMIVDLLSGHFPGKFMVRQQAYIARVIYPLRVRNRATMASGLTSPRNEAFVLDRGTSYGNVFANDSIHNVLEYNFEIWNIMYLCVYSTIKQ